MAGRPWTGGEPNDRSLLTADMLRTQAVSQPGSLRKSGFRFIMIGGDAMNRFGTVKVAWISSLTSLPRAVL